MNTASPEPVLLSPAELSLQGATLAQEIIDKVLRHEPRRTVVVLEALTLLYLFHAKSLPPDAMGSCAMSLGAVAGELLQTSASVPRTTHTSTAVH